MGHRVRQRLEIYASRGIRFYAPDVAFADAEKYLPPLLVKRGKPVADLPGPRLEYLQHFIESVDPEFYGIHFNCVDIVCTLVYCGCVDRRTDMRSTETSERGSRGVTINLRADHTKRALIDRAAQRLGKNRSEFMLEAACREATEVLLDQRLFMLDEKAYKRFTEALDRPPSENKRLKRLMMSKAPWER